MNKEQRYLQEYLLVHHPAMKLKKSLDLIDSEYGNTPIVENAAPILDAKETLKKYFDYLEDIRTSTYRRLGSVITGKEMEGYITLPPHTFEWLENFVLTNRSKEADALGLMGLSARKGIGKVITARNNVWNSFSIPSGRSFQTARQITEFPRQICIRCMLIRKSMVQIM